MRVFKLSLLFILAALFLAACSRVQTPEESYNQPYEANLPYEAGRVAEGFNFDEEYVRENLDLQTVGTLLERADNAEEFEYLLNTEGVSNLDLNDDGYADYISVREFGDNYEDERGFSLFSMFGPELIQEIATIIFDRERYDDGYYPGARVLLRGDEDLYGDNYYYETNWLDRTIPIISWIFSERDRDYSSPYYLENYPSYYEPYLVVEPVVYRTRIEPYYATPVFVQTAQPTVTEIQIVSPYRDETVKDVYKKLPKLKPEQVKYRNNPGPPNFVREKQPKMKEFSVKDDKRLREIPNRPGKPEKVKTKRPKQMREMRAKPNKPERVNVPQRNIVGFERMNQQRPKPQKIERPNQMRMERPNMKPQKQEVHVQPSRGGNPNKGVGNPNKGGGNPNKGGGNPNKGGGKGKGKP